ncbi:MAG: universal stress protein [Deltaproteobacteria bacterium]|nr:universal stress protein [Deltaproteobacteria bacterium]
MFDPKTILIPVEIDVDDFGWLSTALQFSRRVTADVYILFVNDSQAGYRHPAIDAEELEEKIREALEPEDLDGLSMHFLTSKGDLSSRVKEICVENQIDMIATGHKHHSRLYGRLFDTKDEEIIDTVSVPVLVIPK